MKPMDMAEALFGSDDDAIGKPEGSVDTSAMAAIAAHLAREDAGPAPATAPAAASAGRDENETRAGGVTLLGNQHTQYPTDYDPSVLETFENKHPGNDYFVKFNCPEFTSLCPITGQPDFATIYISYVPDVRMVESKSLKLYLFSFRNHGDFHEDCMNIIMKGHSSRSWIRSTSRSGASSPRAAASPSTRTATTGVPALAGRKWPGRACPSTISTPRKWTTARCCATRCRASIDGLRGAARAVPWEIAAPPSCCGDRMRALCENTLRTTKKNARKVASTL